MQVSKESDEDDDWKVDFHCKKVTCSPKWGAVNDAKYSHTPIRIRARQSDAELSGSESGYSYTCEKRLLTASGSSYEGFDVIARSSTVSYGPTLSGYTWAQMGDDAKTIQMLPIFSRSPSGESSQPTLNYCVRIADDTSNTSIIIVMQSDSTVNYVEQYTFNCEEEGAVIIIHRPTGKLTYHHYTRTPVPLKYDINSDLSPRWNESAFEEWRTLTGCMHKDARHRLDPNELPLCIVPCNAVRRPGDTYVRISAERADISAFVHFKRQDVSVLVTAVCTGKNEINTPSATVCGNGDKNTAFASLATVEGDDIVLLRSMKDNTLPTAVYSLAKLADDKLTWSQAANAIPLSGTNVADDALLGAVVSSTLKNNSITLIARQTEVDTVSVSIHNNLTNLKTSTTFKLNKIEEKDQRKYQNNTEETTDADISSTSKSGWNEYTQKALKLQGIRIIVFPVADDSTVQHFAVTKCGYKNTHYTYNIDPVLTKLPADASTLSDVPCLRDTIPYGECDLFRTKKCQFSAVLPLRAGISTQAFSRIWPLRTVAPFAGHRRFHTKRDFWSARLKSDHWADDVDKASQMLQANAFEVESMTVRPTAIHTLGVSLDWTADQSKRDNYNVVAGRFGDLVAVLASNPRAESTEELAYTSPEGLISKLYPGYTDLNGRTSQEFADGLFALAFAYRPPTGLSLLGATSIKTFDPEKPYDNFNFFATAYTNPADAVSIWGRRRQMFALSQTGAYTGVFRRKPRDLEPVKDERATTLAEASRFADHPAEALQWTRIGSSTEETTSILTRSTVVDNIVTVNATYDARDDDGKVTVTAVFFASSGTTLNVHITTGASDVFDMSEPIVVCPSDTTAVVAINIENKWYFTGFDTDTHVVTDNATYNSAWITIDDLIVATRTAFHHIDPSGNVNVWTPRTANEDPWTRGRVDTTTLGIVAGDGLIQYASGMPRTVQFTSDVVAVCTRNFTSNTLMVHVFLYFGKFNVNQPPYILIWKETIDVKMHDMSMECPTVAFVPNRMASFDLTWASNVLRNPIPYVVADDKITSGSYCKGHDLEAKLDTQGKQHDVRYNQRGASRELSAITVAPTNNETDGLRIWFGWTYLLQSRFDAGTTVTFDSVKVGYKIRLKACADTDDLADLSNRSNVKHDTIYTVTKKNENSVTAKHHADTVTLAPSDMTSFARITTGRERSPLRYQYSVTTNYIDIAPDARHQVINRDQHYATLEDKLANQGDISAQPVEVRLHARTPHNKDVVASSWDVPSMTENAIACYPWGEAYTDCNFRHRENADTLSIDRTLNYLWRPWLADSSSESFLTGNGLSAQFADPNTKCLPSAANEYFNVARGPGLESVLCENQILTTFTETLVSRTNGSFDKEKAFKIACQYSNEELVIKEALVIPDGLLTVACSGSGSYRVMLAYNSKALQEDTVANYHNPTEVHEQIRSVRNAGQTVERSKSSSTASFRAQPNQIDGKAYSFGGTGVDVLTFEEFFELEAVTTVAYAAGTPVRIDFSSEAPVSGMTNYAANNDIVRGDGSNEITYCDDGGNEVADSATVAYKFVSITVGNRKFAFELVVLKEHELQFFLPCANVQECTLTIHPSKRLKKNSTGTTLTVKCSDFKKSFTFTCNPASSCIYPQFAALADNKVIGASARSEVARACDDNDFFTYSLCYSPLVEPVDTYATAEKGTEIVEYNQRQYATVLPLNVATKSLPTRLSMTDTSTELIHLLPDNAPGYTACNSADGARFNAAANPAAFQLVRFWKIDQRLLLDTSFRVNLALPTDAGCVLRLSIRDRAAVLEYAPLGKSRKMILSYDVKALSNARTAEAIAYSIPPKHDPTNPDAKECITKLVTTLMGQPNTTDEHTALVTLAQAVGRQYEMQRNGGLDAQQLAKQLDGTLAETYVIQNSAVETYYAVTGGGTTGQEYIPAQTNEEGNTARTDTWLYRLSGCNVRPGDGYNRPDLSNGRFLAPELVQANIDRSIGDATMRPIHKYEKASGYTTPDFNRLRYSYVAENTDDMVRYNARAQKITVDSTNTTQREWYLPVFREELTFDRSSDDSDSTLIGDLRKMMPPLPPKDALSTKKGVLSTARRIDPARIPTGEDATVLQIATSNTIRDISRLVPTRTFDSNPAGELQPQGDVLKALVSIAKKQILLVTCHVACVSVKLAKGAIYDPATQEIAVVNINAVKYQVFAADDPFTILLSNKTVTSSVNIQAPSGILYNYIGYLRDKDYATWNVDANATLTPVMVEHVNLKWIAAFVVRSTIKIWYTGSSVGNSVRTSDSDKFLKWRLRTFNDREATFVPVGSDGLGLGPSAAELKVTLSTSRYNNAFCTLLADAKASSADFNFYFLFAQNILELTTHNVQLTFASHAAIHDTSKSVYALLPRQKEGPKKQTEGCSAVLNGAYQFAELFRSCDTTGRQAFVTGNIDGNRIRIARVENVTVSDQGNPGDNNWRVSQFAIMNDTGLQTINYVPNGNDTFGLIASVCASNLYCVCRFAGSDSFQTRRFLKGVVQFLLDDEQYLQLTGNLFMVSPVPTDTDTGPSSRISVNSGELGMWCAERFAGFFYPDNKFVQTGLRAVFVGNGATLRDSKGFPHAQLKLLIEELQVNPVYLAGPTRGLTQPTFTDEDDKDPDKLAQQTLYKRQRLYHLLETAPADYKLVVPLTVSLSGRSITPTHMDVEHHVVLTARYHQASNVILSEVKKVMRDVDPETTIDAKLCCEADPIAYGEALMDQALINVQTLDSGLHFKDRSALRLSVQQRKSAVYRLVGAIKKRKATGNPTIHVKPPA